MSKSEQRLLNLSLAAFVLPLLAATVLAMVGYLMQDYWGRGLTSWYWPVGFAGILAGWILVWKYSDEDQALPAVLILFGITFLDLFLLIVLAFFFDGALYGNYL